MITDPGHSHALLVTAHERISYGWIDSRCIIAIDPSHTHDFWRLGKITYRPAAPHIWVPKLTLPEAAIVGAAAAVIRNPVVTRRFWAGWISAA